MDILLCSCSVSHILIHRIRYMLWTYIADLGMSPYDVLIQLVAVKFFAFLDNVPQAKIDCIVFFCAGQECFSFDAPA